MAHDVQCVRIAERRVGEEQDPQAHALEPGIGGQVGEGIGVALVGEVEGRRLVGPRLEVPTRDGRHLRRLPQRQLLQVRSGRIAARHERGAHGGDAAERRGGRRGRGHARRIGGRPDDRKPARNERAV